MTLPVDQLGLAGDPPAPVGGRLSRAERVKAIVDKLDRVAGLELLAEDGIRALHAQTANAYLGVSRQLAREKGGARVLWVSALQGGAGDGRGFTWSLRFRDREVLCFRTVVGGHPYPRPVIASCEVLDGRQRAIGELWLVNENGAARWMVGEGDQFPQALSEDALLCLLDHYADDALRRYRQPVS